jgi:hypothetical protein
VQALPTMPRHGVNTVDAPLQVRVKSQKNYIVLISVIGNSTKVDILLSRATYKDILRKEYCTRRGRALETFRTRAKSRGRPVTSDRPPPRRCGQAAWTAAGRPIFATGEVF